MLVEGGGGGALCHVEAEDVFEFHDGEIFEGMTVEVGLRPSTSNWEEPRTCLTRRSMWSWLRARDLILEGDGAAVDVVGGDPVVAEHEADGFAAGCFQSVAEDRVGHFSFLDSAALEPREVAVIDDLADGAAFVDSGAVGGDEFADVLFVEHLGGDGWCLALLLLPDGVGGESKFISKLKIDPG